MSKLKDLKKCKTLKDLSLLLGFEAKHLSYVLFFLKDEDKYQEFTVSKKNGGNRIINSPNKQLKEIQKKLANFLYECSEEIKPEKEKLKYYRNNEKKNIKLRATRSISHGYEKGLSIMSNASCHRNKRFVYNVDLKNFFPSFNFGRVRGYFIKSKHFRLHPKVATLLAQIACFKNELPQGSPCSPVISNLICRNLDLRILKLAKSKNCQYTRYVDDLTFSTNYKKFPKGISIYAFKIFYKEWNLGRDLEKIILDEGFKVNIKKCRMQSSNLRQEATGIVVNDVVNVPKEYYRNARSMCNSLFEKGYYYKRKRLRVNSVSQGFIWALLEKINLFKKNNIDKVVYEDVQSTSIDKLVGIISYIYNVRKYRNQFAIYGYRRFRHDGASINGEKIYPPKNRSSSYSDESHVVAIDGIKNLYKKLLFFKYFYKPDKPLIICEGPTDNIYIKCAIKALLVNSVREEVRFFNKTENNMDVLKLAEGTGGLSYLIKIYKREFKRYKCNGREYPVIIVVDDDEAGRGVIKCAIKIRDEIRKANNVNKVRCVGYMFENLYVLNVNNISNNSSKSTSVIEDLFESDAFDLGRKIMGGREFNKSNSSFDLKSFYGKMDFSEKVVKPNYKNINFNKFQPFIDSINTIIKNHDYTDLD